MLGLEWKMISFVVAGSCVVVEYFEQRSVSYSVHSDTSDLPDGATPLLLAPLVTKIQRLYFVVITLPITLKVND